MTRGRRRILAVLAAAALGAAAALHAVRSGGSSPRIATLSVRADRVVRRIVADGQLTAVHSTPLTVPVRRGGRSYRVSWLIPEGSTVAAGDVIARFDPGEFERELEEGAAERSIADARLGAAEARRQGALRDSERARTLSAHELDVSQRFQATDASLYSANEIAASAIDTELARRRSEHADESMAIRDEHSKTDLALIAIDQRKAGIKMEQAREGLQTLELAAPHAGLVVFERDWRGNSVEVGETAWPGRVIANLPDLSELEAEVYVLEADAGGLVAGQEASVIVEAHPETVHRATVKAVDPIAQPRWRSPVQYFRAVLALERTDPAVMRPGQTIRAEIILGRHDGAIAVPRQAVFERAGRSVVYCLQGKDFVEVEVSLGASGPGRVLVTAGLDDGDVIALADPHQSPPSEPQAGEHASSGPAVEGAIP